MPLSKDTITLLGLFSDLALPLVLLFLGWGYAAYSARIEDRRARLRMAAEWRLEVFRELTDALNKVRQFYTYVGAWAAIKPDELIAIKRRLDHLVWGNGFLWSEETLNVYRAFTSATFEQERGRGTKMLLKANVEMHAERQDWMEDWRDRFVPSDQRISRNTFLEVHDTFQGAIIKDLDLLPRRL